MQLVCKLTMNLETLAGKRTLFILVKMGNLRWYFSPQLRFQAVGLAIHVVKQSCIWTLETWYMYSVERVENWTCERNLMGHLSPGHLSMTHSCRKKKGRETKGNEWVGKEKQDLQKGGNKWQHPKGLNLLEHCYETMRVTCVAMSLHKLEPERAHG